jgi:hypothetical protein
MTDASHMVIEAVAGRARRTATRGRSQVKGLRTPFHPATAWSGRRRHRPHVDRGETLGLVGESAAARA